MPSEGSIEFEVNDSATEEESHKIYPDSEGFFTIPCSDLRAQRDFFNRVLDAHVTVIGMFGKSQNPNDPLEYAKIFDRFLHKDVFRFCRFNTECQSTEPCIIGFHDDRSNKIFLVLCIPSIFEKTAEAESDESSFISNLATREVQSSKLMIIMFHVCHILICYNPGHTFDLSYVPLLKSLDNIRLKCQDNLSNYLKSDLAFLPSDWIKRGRISLPKLLIYFASVPKGLRGRSGNENYVKRDGTLSKHPPIRKLEFSLEDQIYRILKKAKIITNPNVNCLFSLPTRDGYVYVHNGYEEGDFGDHTYNLLSKLMKSYEINRAPVDSGGPFVPFFHQHSISEAHKSQRCFEGYLDSQLEAFCVKQVPIKNRADSEENNDKGQNDENYTSAKQWYSFLEKIHSFFITESDSLVGKTKYPNLLGTHLSLESKFSEYRCSKILPRAIATYKEGLPSHYVEEHHQAKLLQAMSLFMVQAKGPSIGKYNQILIKECTEYWKSGRQMCEQISLTGHQCRQRKHRSLEEKPKKEDSDNSDDEQDVRSKNRRTRPIMPHSSGVEFLKACNCGKTQTDRPDPFTLIEANYLGYVEDCCSVLEQIEVPHADSSQTSLQTPDENSSPKPETFTSDAVSKDKLQSLATLASKLPGDKQSDDNADVKSGTLKTLMTLKTPPGLLPAFPSWALTQLGYAHLYVHSSGVTQPGMMSGTKNLHSWDIKLSNIDWQTLRTKWPNLADLAMKRPSFKFNEKNLDMTVSVKVFLGLEYECPKGHRFIASNVEKTVRNKSSTSAATKMVASDIPLYMACPCRSSPARVGQLMRLHVVTPKAPIHVIVNPQVVPCPDGPVFHPGWQEPIKLPINTYWVLRFPLIYWGESGCHTPPKEVPPLNHGKLLKGFISISEDYQ